jgi:ribosomal protein S18 acetylase RimI-like enzyme
MTHIRAAAPTDRDAILRLSERLGDFPVPSWRTAAEIAQADHHLLLQALRATAPERVLLVGESDGTVLGFVLVVEREDYFTHERLAHVEDLALDPAAEGRGLARRLMDEAEAWARGRGYGRITLNVWAQNTRAIGLYQRLGYQPETVHYIKAL